MFRFNVLLTWDLKRKHFQMNRSQGKIKQCTNVLCKMLVLTSRVVTFEIYNRLLLVEIWML